MKHLIYSLNVDTGATNSGWPVNLNTSAQFGGTVFNSTVENQHGALALVNGILYVPYGAHNGDCGTYHGWLVGIPLDDPTSVTAWATGARGGGSWAVGGVASDGTATFIATGNTFGASTWSGGEAIIRFQPGPVFSGSSVDYWAPTNWPALDNADLDLGGSGPLLVDVPGANPSALVVALGKDGNAYLLNRTNLGGISLPVAQAHVGSGPITQAAVTYQTGGSTYVVFCRWNGLTAFTITPTSPPTITNAWTVPGIFGSPFATSTDGTSDVVVWGTGNAGLYGFDGRSGAVVYSGGGDNGLLYGEEAFNTGIAARGRIYIANDNQVYAFSVPVPPIVLTNAAVSPAGGFQFGFTNVPGLSFTVFDTTNVSQPFTNWTRLGTATETSPGQFQFAAQPTTAQSFYRVRSP